MGAGPAACCEAGGAGWQAANSNDMHAAQLMHRVRLRNDRLNAILTSYGGLATMLPLAVVAGIGADCLIDDRCAA